MIDGGATVVANLPDAAELPTLREAVSARRTVTFRYHDLDRAVDPWGLLLRDGPDVGVHTVVWSSSLEAVERRLGRAALREFALRVVTSLDEDDSLALIDSAAAASLRPNQALLHDEDWGRLVRFRPYLPPPSSWLVGLSNAAAGVSGEGR